MYGIIKTKIRNKLDIYAGILAYSLKEVRKTHIIGKANLNSVSVKRYLSKLLERGLISKIKEPFTNRHLYKTTPKGKNFLYNYRILLQAIEDEEQQKSARARKILLKRDRRQPARAEGSLSMWLSR